MVDVRSDGKNLLILRAASVARTCTRIYLPYISLLYLLIPNSMRDHIAPPIFIPSPISKNNSGSSREEEEEEEYFSSSKSIFAQLASFNSSTG